MSISVIAQVPVAIQIHVVCAMLALVLGACLLLGRKGNDTHRMIGRIWIGAMAITAISSFFMSSLRLHSGFSPIHILSVFTLIGCCQVVVAARASRIAEHRRHVGNLYSFALLTAGAFSLLPGRMMNTLLFGGGKGQPHLIAIGLLLMIVLLFQWWLRRGRAR